MCVEGNHAVTIRHLTWQSRRSRTRDWVFSGTPRHPKRTTNERPDDSAARLRTIAGGASAICQLSSGSSRGRSLRESIRQQSTPGRDDLAGVIWDGGEAARPPSGTDFEYSQEVQPTAPTRAGFRRPPKYDSYPRRLQSTAGKELQNRGPRVRILPPLLSPQSSLSSRAGGPVP